MIQNAKMLKFLEFLGDIVLDLEDLKTFKSMKLEVAQESEWAKEKVVLNCGNSVFERNRVDSGY
ncbi:hypothetical protein H5410_027416 [Solanum commersonii]|uniref:Uncharacterized protein n=1 Tax=Solanum commersonii TaxID=4109 RepID=A0A9J5Z3B2_SOLCO|nr:hypothetical protein H5410_027416 [Solanum commersonii]